MKRLSVVALVAIASMALVSCGDDDGGSADNHTINVTADSYKFTPNTWTVAGNADFTVTLTNANDVDEHEWAVLNEGVTISSEAEFEEELVLTEIEAVPPGGSETATFNFPPGTYQVICALEGHFDSGMTGTLTVTG